MTVAQRFWAKVDKGQGCWPWLAGKQERGYGHFWFNGRQIGAHRMAWILSRGPIPDGFYVCHRCDNPSCVRPTHLFVGRAKDNLRDAMQKGRMPRGVKWRDTHRNMASGDRHKSVTYPESVPRGESHGMSKLTDSIVKEIRRLGGRGISNRKLGRKFGVTKSTIQKVIRKRIWKHVGGVPYPKES